MTWTHRGETAVLFL